MANSAVEGTGVPRSQAADSIPAVLAEPKLEQFGLRARDIEMLPRTFFDVHGGTFYGTSLKKNHNQIAVGIALLVFAVLTMAPWLGVWRAIELPLVSIVGIPAILFGAFSLLHPVEVAVYCAFSTKYASYHQFEKARADYQKRLALYQDWLARQKEAYWRSLPGVAFERALGELYSRMGYAVQHTPHSGDGGVDLVLRKDGKLTVVQCKAHNKRVPISVARELRASIADFSADEGVIACIDGVTQPVTDYIKDKKIVVLDVRDIVALQNKFA
jgi:hypothetical protein